MGSLASAFATSGPTRAILPKIMEDERSLIDVRATYRRSSPTYEEPRVPR